MRLVGKRKQRQSQNSDQDTRDTRGNIAHQCIRSLRDAAKTANCEEQGFWFVLPHDIKKQNRKADNSSHNLSNLLGFEKNTLAKMIYEGRRSRKNRRDFVLETFELEAKQVDVFERDYVLVNFSLSRQSLLAGKDCLDCEENWPPLWSRAVFQNKDSNVLDRNDENILGYSTPQKCDNTDIKCHEHEEEDVDEAPSFLRSILRTGSQQRQSKRQRVHFDSSSSNVFMGKVNAVFQKIVSPFTSKLKRNKEYEVRSDSTRNLLGVFETNAVNQQNHDHMDNEYPRLKQLRLPTNISNANERIKLETVIKDITKLYAKSKLPMYFDHGNSRFRGRLVSIPSFTNIDSFYNHSLANQPSNQTNTSSWISEILDHLVSKKEDLNLTDEDAAEWLMGYFAKKYDEKFIEVAKGNGMILIQRMDEIQASAMWTDANIPQTGEFILNESILSLFDTLTSFSRTWINYPHSLLLCFHSPESNLEALEGSIWISSSGPNEGKNKPSCL